MALWLVLEDPGAFCAALAFSQTVSVWISSGKSGFQKYAVKLETLKLGLWMCVHLCTLQLTGDPFGCFAQFVSPTVTLEGLNVRLKQNLPNNLHEQTHTVSTHEVHDHEMEHGVGEKKVRKSSLG